MRTKEEKLLVKSGLDRIDRILEVDRFLKAQIQMKVALKALFSRFEIFLIKNNRRFVIDDHEDKGKRSKKSPLPYESLNFDD